jgi:hypothetical protein
VRIALLTFLLLACIGIAIGHTAREPAQPRVEDRSGTVRVKF